VVLTSWRATTWASFLLRRPQQHCSPDYILTVAVSISSGVAQITSAFPALYPYRVEISVALVFFVMLVNLRGVKESGAIFAAPTYFFIIGMFIEEISAQRQPNEIITVVVPQFVPKKRWHNLLHTQTALFLRMALLFKPGIVITDVPYQLH
jgi:K+ transporter